MSIFGDIATAAREVTARHDLGEGASAGAPLEGSVGDAMREVGATLREASAKVLEASHEMVDVVIAEPVDADAEEIMAEQEPVTATDDAPETSAADTDADVESD